MKRKIRKVLVALLICLSLIAGMSASQIVNIHHVQASGTMVLTNTDFESGLTGWTRLWGSATSYIQVLTEKVFSGSRCLKVYDDSSSSIGVMSDKVPAIAGEEYLASVKLYIAQKGGHIQLRFYDSMGNLLGTKDKYCGLPTSQWTYISVQGYAPTGTTQLALFLYSDGASVSTLYFDDVNLIQLPVSNHSLENGLTGWSRLWGSATSYIETSTQQAFSGSYSVKIYDDSDSASIVAGSDEITALEGERYQASAKLYIEQKGGHLQLRFYNDSCTLLGSEDTHIGTPVNQWTDISVQGTAPVGTAKVAIWAYSDSASISTLYYDDIRLEVAPLTNNSFESDKTGWTQIWGDPSYVTSVTEEKFSGSCSLKIIDASSTGGMAVESDKVSAIEGKEYELSGYYYIEEGEGAHAELMFYDSSNNLLSTSSDEISCTGENQWWPFELKTYAHEGATQVAVRLWTSSSHVGTVYFDDIGIKRLDKIYDLPAITPISGHPRLEATSSSVVTLQAKIQSPQFEDSWNTVVELSGFDTSTAVDSKDIRLLLYSEANAFRYLLDNTNTTAGYNAISQAYIILQNTWPQDTYNIPGRYILAGARVYDWCYDLLTQQQKEHFIYHFKRLASLLECGYPPVRQSCIGSHVAEKCVQSHLLAGGIAVYDEDSEIYNYAAGRFFTEYVPALNYSYQAGYHHQGSNGYGDLYFYPALYPMTFYEAMGYNDIFDEAQGEVPYSWIYLRRPDGRNLIDSDSMFKSVLSAYSLKVYDSDPNNSVAAYSDFYDVEEGKEYKAAAKLYIAEHGGHISLRFYDASESFLQEEDNYYSTPANQWSSIDVSAFAPANASKVRIALYSDASSVSELYYDDITLTELPSSNVTITNYSFEDALLGWTEMWGAQGRYIEQSTEQVYHYYNKDLSTVYMMAGSLYQNSYYVNELERYNPEGKYDGFAAMEHIMYTDTSVTSQSTTNLPLTKYFGSPIGTMIARTGWDEGIDVESPTVVAEMKIGEYFYGGHQHLDSGSFEIYYKGPLAIDSGLYNGTSGAFRSPHNLNYFKRTIAHNSILIYDPNEVALKSDTTSYVNDGGQRLPDEYRTPVNLDELLNDGYKMAEVLAHEFGSDSVSPDYSYIKGDLTQAYSEKVSQYQRSFAFLNFKNTDHPAALVVFDKVVSADTDFDKYWLLHSMDEPSVSGNVTTITRTDSVYGYNGKLINHTLLPLQNNLSINKIGGSGYDFWVFGTNYENESTIGLDKMNTEQGEWRVEISPVTASDTDYFLNVMQVQDDVGGPIPLTPEKIEDVLVTGAKIYDRVVLFSKSGDRLSQNVAFTASGSGTIKYMIADLAAGTWEVYKDGNIAATGEVTQEGGVLYFEGTSGTYTLTKTN